MRWLSFSFLYIYKNRNEKKSKNFLLFFVLYGIYNNKGGENVDANVLAQLVGSLGFPIVVCGVMFYIYRENLNSLKQSLDDNTNMINEMKTMIQTFMEYIAKDKTGGA